jgi:hypothetical protein
MVKIAKTIYVNSSNMAKIMNLGSPKGIPIIPITIIDIKTINTRKLGFLINDLILINYKSIKFHLYNYQYVIFAFLIYY